MRTTLIGALALSTGLVTGCAALDSDLQHRGSLRNIETNGLVLFEDGETGHAAMYDTTCVVDSDGAVAADVDVVSEDAEEVVDGTSTGDGSTVLARTRGELHIIHNSLDMSGWSDDAVQTHLPVPDVIDARFTDDGVAALAGCEVRWLDTESGAVNSTMSLADMDCEGMGQTLDVDAATGTAYVDIAGLVHAVTPDAVSPVVQGDLFAFSSDEVGVLAADAGQNTVRFAELDGTERWSVDLGAPVADVVDLGARGWMGVMVEMPGERGQLTILDAATGVTVKSFDLPGVADVVASANGQTIALVLPRDVHYYNLR